VRRWQQKPKGQPPAQTTLRAHHCHSTIPATSVLQGASLGPRFTRMPRLIYSQAFAHILHLLVQGQGPPTSCLALPLSYGSVRC
jgi:hypothetical protein